MKIAEKTFQFALNSIKIHKKIIEVKEYTIANQFIKCSTSIGANVAEAQQAESKADFIHKLSIALKENCESRFWCNLILHAQILEKEIIKDHISEADEIFYTLTSIIKKTKSNMDSK